MNHPSELILRLARVGIMLHHTDNRVHFAAPKGTFTDKLRAEAKANEAAILASLKNDEIRCHEDNRWRRTLVEAGLPPDLLVVDFETYFDDKYSLTRMDVAGYVSNPLFAFLGVSIKRPGCCPEFHVDVPAAIRGLQSEFGDNFERITVASHNYGFDGAILAWRFGVHPPSVVDTLGLARVRYPRHANDLRSLALRMNLPPKLDCLAQFRGVRNPTPQALHQLSTYAKRDAYLCYHIARRLLPVLTRPGFELQLMRHTFNLAFNPTLMLDMSAAGELESELGGMLSGSLAAAGIDIKTARSDDQFKQRLSAALEANGESLESILNTNGGITLSKHGAARQALLVHRDPVVRNLVQAYADANSLPGHIKRIQTLMSQSRLFDGRLPVFLKYSGASTGRFSGDARQNLQNLPSRGHTPESRIRKLIKAADGYQLVIADAAQIECRVLAWLAGENQLISSFKARRDIYSEFASVIYNAPVRKPTIGDPPDIAAELTARRQVGKLAVLGLGYGMSAKAFLNTLATCDDLRQMIAGGHIDHDFCDHIKMTFRDTFFNIPALWRSMEAAFITASRGGRIDGVGMSSFMPGDNHVVISLPSGRHLYFPDVMVQGTRDITCSKDHLYGGKIVQNVVQAVARDVLCEAILSLETQGFPVVLHVHDEVVLHVPMEQVSLASTAAEKALSTAPAWLPDLPLAAEVKTGDCYAK